MKDIIKVENLYKYYPSKTSKIGEPAVNDISFTVNEGEFFGFLGPNGAGKSTTINILCTIIEKSRGNILIRGLDISYNQSKIREEIGIIFQEKTLDDRLTAYENLKIHAKLYNIKKENIDNRINDVLEVVELLDKKKNFVSTFSGGMKRRLEIARGLIHMPKILFLDEPTTGLDPQTRAKIWDYLLKLKNKFNMTIFLTTHYMDEAEICDNIAIMDKGKIVAYGTPIELKEQFAHNEVKFTTKDNKETVEFLRKNFTYEVDYDEQFVCVKIKESSTQFVKDLIRNHKIEVEHLEINRPTLNNVFLNITGKEIRD